MQSSIFRAYDIRGKVGSELIISEVYQFARAVAFYYTQKNNPVNAVAVGMDGRIHSKQIAQELIAGLQASGLEVLFLGQCTTPMLYYSQYCLPVQAGIMITASHNPAEYNGFKLIHDKQPISLELLQELKHYYLEKKEVISEQPGECKLVSVKEQYLAFLTHQFKHLVDSDIALLFDCANGAAGFLIHDLIKAFNWKNTHVIHGAVTGEFLHHEPDPSKEKNMTDLKKAVLMQHADLGIGFDGDADRMGAVTDDGIVLSGDKLLGLFAQEIIKKEKKLHVVFDQKCSDGLKELLHKWGAIGYESRTGHTFIKQIMQQTGAQLAGELSCHFFFADRYYGFDDGIYAALRLIEIVAQDKKAVTKFLTLFPHRVNSPELRIACPVYQGPKIVAAVKEHFEKSDAKLCTLDGVKVITECSWALIRSSNTESVISLRFEAVNQEHLDAIKQKFVALLSDYLPQELLKESVTW